jgi:hypothetical protein
MTIVDLSLLEQSIVCVYKNGMLNAYRLSGNYASHKGLSAMINDYY